MDMFIIEMVDHPRIVNTDNAMVDLVGKTEDTFLYICTGARVPQFPLGNSIFQNVVTQLGYEGGARISVNPTRRTHSKICSFGKLVEVGSDVRESSDSRPEKAGIYCSRHEARPRPTTFVDAHDMTTKTFGDGDGND
jgi:hypothetical protein